MKLRRFFPVLIFSALALFARAQEAAATPTAAQQQAATNNAVAAAVATGRVEARTPDFIEHVVDEILLMFDVTHPNNENTWVHFTIALLFIVIAIVLRRVVTNLIFGSLRKLASKTETTLDDKLFAALQSPISATVMLIGIFSALRVLKVSETGDRAIDFGSRVAFSLAVFWGLSRALGALLDHAQEIAARRNMGVAAFMPWIKKTIITIFVIFGVLMVVQSLGYDVKAILAGLGIGGLAFALAAQDTLANIFGSIVVAIDQPFKIGEAVKIGAHEGSVEDIGLRSTKLRTPGRNLIIIPNKMVAAEPVVNNSRFIARRVEQVFALTYDTTAEQMQAMVDEIRGIITSEKEVDPASVHTYFRDLNASSLDIWVAYNTKDPDFAKSMALRQRINLAIMRAVQKRGLSFAFPTTTFRLAGGGERPANPANPVDKLLGREGAAGGGAVKS